jgi:uncharacterized repeat protein (TIGR01451 family)
MDKNNILKVGVLLAVLVIGFFVWTRPILASPTLYTNVWALPSSGNAPLTGVGIGVQVYGSAVGDITYKIDCSSDSIWEVNQLSSNAYFSVSNLCGYASAGNYTVTVKVERENVSYQKTILIQVQPLGLPTVDLKVNNFDDSATISSGSPVNLSWTSTNAVNCMASGDWSDSKAVSGSQTLGNLTGVKNYTLTCSGSGSSATDSVMVLASEPETLTVTLEATPNSGNVSLNGVDLKATVLGTALGTINYKFDCTSDGTWDYSFNAVSENPKTVIDACNYSNVGVYTARVMVERGSSTTQATVQISVVSPSGSQDVSVSTTGRNLSDGTGFAEIVAADPGEVVQFGIVVTANGNNTINNLTVRDTLPDKTSYYGNLTLDGISISGDILAGLNIGSLAPQQSKTIVFQARVNSATSFSLGTTELVNTAIVYNDILARTDSATIQVTKTGVQGATDVPTGIFDNAKFALLLSLLVTFAVTYFLLLKSYVGKKIYAWGIDEAFGSLKDKTSRFLAKKEDSQEKLMKLVEEIRKRENL